MSLYIDTSCLWKLLLLEPESAQTRVIVEAEPLVIVSNLAELEVEQQLLAQRLGGRLSLRTYRQVRATLASFRGTAPFAHKTTNHDLAQIARRQATAAPYCRTADRLHLAAMEALGVQRLLTHDDQQAAAAAARGFGVVRPQ